MAGKLKNTGIRLCPRVQKRLHIFAVQHDLRVGDAVALGLALLEALPAEALAERLVAHGHAQAGERINGIKKVVPCK